MTFYIFALICEICTLRCCLVKCLLRTRGRNWVFKLKVCINRTAAQLMNRVLTVFNQSFAAALHKKLI